MKETKKYILAIDKGTTGTRALLFDKGFDVVSQAYKEIPHLHPEPGHVEMDPEHIYGYTVEMIRECVEKSHIDPSEIEAVGITYQRGTYLMWDRDTGRPLYNAVVWMDHRTQPGAEVLLSMDGFAEKNPERAASIRQSSSLDTYCSLAQVRRENPQLVEAMKKPGVLFGFVDTWLLWKLTDGKSFKKDSSYLAFLNKPRTLYEYDDAAMPFVGLRPDMMPQLCPAIHDYGMMKKDILGVELPIRAVLGDQQSGLFAHGCRKEGQAKVTLGTVGVVDLNLGQELRFVPGAFPMIAWQIGDEYSYNAEGALMAGNCLKWGRDNLKLYKDFRELDQLAASVPDNGGVYFVPALSGLGAAPFFDPTARGSFMGMSLDSTREHMCRALLESVGYAVAHLLKSMTDGARVVSISADGGVSQGDITCQTLANVTGATVIRPHMVEGTALGIAELTAVAAGWYTWDETASIMKHFGAEEFVPDLQRQEKTQKEFETWLLACERSLHWTGKS